MRRVWVLFDLSLTVSNFIGETVRIVASVRLVQGNLHREAVIAVSALGLLHAGHGVPEELSKTCTETRVDAECGGSADSGSSRFKRVIEGSGASFRPSVHAASDAVEVRQDVLHRKTGQLPSRKFGLALMCSNVVRSDSLRQSIKQACSDESLYEGLWWTLDLIGRTGSHSLVTIEVQGMTQRCPFGLQDLHPNAGRGIHGCDHRNQQELDHGGSSVSSTCDTAAQGSFQRWWCSVLGACGQVSKGGYTTGQLLLCIHYTLSGQNVSRESELHVPGPEESRCKSSSWGTL